MLFQRCLASAALLGSVLAQAKLKIMPLGDSITEITCWRTLVWQNLQKAGVANNVDFVGSMSNNPENCASSSGAWDQSHEGHSGYLAANIALYNLPGWLSQNKPDIVNFMLGTNDVLHSGKGTNEIIVAYTSIVKQLRAANPRVRIIVDLAIPLAGGEIRSNPGIISLNNAIPAWAAGMNTAASPIVIVDCYNGFPSNGLRDGIHPSASGDAFIAGRISPALINQIKLALGTTPPISTTRTTARLTTVTTKAAPTTTAIRTTTTAAQGGSGAPLYGQCGGTNWSGPTTCASGTCKVSNPWYSQCL